MTVLLVLAALGGGFGAGLLVGRRNPKIADAAAKAANDAAAKVDSLKS